jgi:hypothetical protein
MVEDSQIKPVPGADRDLQTSVNYLGAAEYLKRFKDFRKIPGLLPSLQFAQNRISQRMFDKKMEILNNPIDKNVTLPAQKTINNVLTNFDVTFPKTLNKENDLFITANYIADDLSTDASNQA